MEKLELISDGLSIDLNNTSYVVMVDGLPIGVVKTEVAAKHAIQVYGNFQLAKLQSVKKPESTRFTVDVHDTTKYILSWQELGWFKNGAINTSVISYVSVKRFVVNDNVPVDIPLLVKPKFNIMNELQVVLTRRRADIVDTDDDL